MQIAEIIQSIGLLMASPFFLIVRYIDAAEINMFFAIGKYSNPENIFFTFSYSFSDFNP